MFWLLPWGYFLWPHPVPPVPPTPVPPVPPTPGPTIQSRKRGSRPAPSRSYGRTMCRNIRTLHNFAPPATRDEVQAAATQYVRKVAGTTRPAQANQAVFEQAVAEVAAATQRLLDGLIAHGAPKDRAVEAAKARARAAERYAR
jgi:hypothetical protein